MTSLSLIIEEFEKHTSSLKSSQKLSQLLVKLKKIYMIIKKYREH